MTAKPFDRDQYNLDDNAKHLVAAWLTKKWGFENARVNPDEYGIDLLAERNGTFYGIEVEVKHNWNGYEFPFANVHWAARKVKFLGVCERTYFVMLSTDRKQALIANDAAFDGAQIVKKDTIHTTNEWFIQVPIEKCKVYEL
jgi:hypothetical protein